MPTFKADCRVRPQTNLRTENAWIRKNDIQTFLSRTNGPWPRNDCIDKPKLISVFNTTQMTILRPPGQNST